MMAKNRMDKVLFEFCNDDNHILSFFNKLIYKDDDEKLDIVVCSVCGQKVDARDPQVTTKNESKTIWEFQCRNDFCEHSHHRLGKMNLSYDEMNMLTFSCIEDRDDYLEDKQKELKILRIAHEREEFSISKYNKKPRKCQICNQEIVYDEQCYERKTKINKMLGRPKEGTYGYYSKKSYTFRDHICLNCWNTKVKVVKID